MHPVVSLLKYFLNKRKVVVEDYGYCGFLIKKINDYEIPVDFTVIAEIAELNTNALIDFKVVTDCTSCEKVFEVVGKVAELARKIDEDFKKLFLKKRKIDLSFSYTPPLALTIQVKSEKEAKETGACTKYSDYILRTVVAVGAFTRIILQKPSIIRLRR